MLPAYQNIGDRIHPRASPWNSAIILEQDIEREVYRLEKAKLLSEKKSLEEQMTRIEQKRTGWLEPMAEWIKEEGKMDEMAGESNLFAKKVTAKEIFGSNLVLAGREACVSAPKSIAFPPQNQWTALCAANEKVGQFSESQILVGMVGLEPTRS